MAVITDLLLDVLIPHEPEHPYCEQCNGGEHAYYLMLQTSRPTDLFVGLECVPDALGYKSTPGVYVAVPSRSGSKAYRVWTGDAVNPPHCPCEAFRYANRSQGDRVGCWHLQQAVGVTEGSDYGPLARRKEN